MPPVKLTYHVVLDSQRHFLLMPFEELEPSYMLVELTHGEVSELAKRFGPAPDWMERLFLCRELRKLLPSRFRRTSRCGDFGAIDLETQKRFRGQIVPGWGLFFGPDRIFGKVIEVETYPGVRPNTNCRTIVLGDFSVGSFFSSGKAGREINIADVVKAEISQEGKVHAEGYGLFTWAPGATLEPERLTILQDLGPEKTYLVKCLDPNDRFVVFLFANVIVLTCPVKHHATFFTELNGHRPGHLPKLLPDKQTALRRGFGRLIHIGHHLLRLREIVEHGRPRTWRDHGKAVQRV